jgi:hypothetical protein
MAGAGKKTFTAGEILTASDTNTYLMEQTVMYFAGTAARASAIPTPSTGMTTYIGTTGTATIPQIESYTGSAFQTLYGLTQVANVSFSAVGSVSLDNVFTSTYTHYRILFNVLTKSTNGFMYLYFRTGGVNNTTGNYNFAGLIGRTSSTTANYGGAAETYGTVNFSNVSPAIASLDIANPQIAAQTTFTTTGFGGDLSTWFNNIGGGNFTTSAQFDGITFAPATGTIGGNIRVYGYRNS